MFARSIGIDLGTANVLVFLKGRGVVLNEPSVVAISTKDGRVKAVGNRVKRPKFILLKSLVDRPKPDGKSDY